MTEVQVFKWFCKEQGIMGEIFSLFHAIEPKKMTYENGTYETIPLNFYEYIKGRITCTGFFELFWAIESAYITKVRNSRWEGKTINDKLITNRFLKAKKNWDYFTKHNLFLNDESLKVGDVIKWNGSEVKIKEIDLRWGNIVGERIGSQAFFGRNVYFKLSGCRDRESNEPLQLNYYIKRNRRIYNGVN